METIMHLPAIPEIGKSCRDHFAIYDMAGFVKAAESLPYKEGGWIGEDTQTAIRHAREGDLSTVAAADKLMTELESLIPMSQQWEQIDSVCGGYVNVPSWLAGIPECMSCMERVGRESAPLCLFVDLTTSAGIKVDMVRKRGVAILALVRMLSNFRPVECWVMTGLGDNYNADYCCVKLDTTPLDLARAAHMLTSTCVARGLGYQLCHKVGNPGRGNWPYASIDATRKHGVAILSRVVHPGSEVLFIPPMHLNDESVTNPVKWIKDKLAQYGGETIVQED